MRKLVLLAGAALTAGFFATSAQAEQRGLDLEWYCQQVYGPGASAFYENRWDAYTWRCTLGMSMYEISIEDACDVQYGREWYAGLRDRWDAFSWYCER